MKLFQPLQRVHYVSIIKYGLLYSVLILLLVFGGRIVYFIFDRYVDEWIDDGFADMQRRMERDFDGGFDRYITRRIFFTEHLRYFLIQVSLIAGFFASTVHYCFLRHKKDKYAIPKNVAEQVAASDR